MKLKRLSDLKRHEPREVALGTLPTDIAMGRFAVDKAFRINALVREVHGESFEWYGFLLAARDEPETVLDVGIPPNEQNLREHARIAAEKIIQFQEALPAEWIINGWIHSHGSLAYRRFSDLDEENHLTVLDFVTSLVRKPIAKREIPVKDLALLVSGSHSEADLREGSVTLVTDAPVRSAWILEAVYGGFCYAVVVGDDGWHEQEILYKRRGILTGETLIHKKKATIRKVETGPFLTALGEEQLREEIRRKVQPPKADPPEHMERL